MNCVSNALWLVRLQQPEASKKEEFRRYLEGAGVLDAFTKGSQSYFPFCDTMTFLRIPTIIFDYFH